MQPIQCPRCWEELPTNESLMEHIRAEPVCANRDPRDHKREGITKTQIDTIKKKETFENAKAKLREEKWFVIWRMLFPNESVPMSPCKFASSCTHKTLTVPQIMNTADSSFPKISSSHKRYNSCGRG